MTRLLLGLSTAGLCIKFRDALHVIFICRIRAFDPSITGTRVTAANDSHELDGSSDVADDSEDNEPGIAHCQYYSFSDVTVGIRDSTLLI